MSQAEKPVKTAQKAPNPAAQKQSPAAVPEAKRAAAKKAVIHKVVAKKAAVKKDQGTPTLIKPVKPRNVPQTIRVINATARGEKVTFTFEKSLSEPTQRSVIVFEGREIDIDAVKARLNRRIANSAARANEKTMGTHQSSTQATRKRNAEIIQDLVRNTATSQSRQSSKATR